MTIKKYYQVLCDRCKNTINDFRNYPSYGELKDNGIVLSKGKHYCSKACKEGNIPLEINGREIR